MSLSMIRTLDDEMEVVWLEWAQKDGRRMMRSINPTVF